MRVSLPPQSKYYSCCRSAGAHSNAKAPMSSNKKHIPLHTLEVFAV